MTKASGPHVTAKGAEYITITEVESAYEKAFDVEVPIDLLIAQQLHGVPAECLPH